MKILKTLVLLAGLIFALMVMIAGAFANPTQDIRDQHAATPPRVDRGDGRIYLCATYTHQRNDGIPPACLPLPAPDGFWVYAGLSGGAVALAWSFTRRRQ